MTDDITLPTKPSGEFVSYCDSYSDGAWRGFDADDMESYARAAVLLDRQQRALRGLAEADRALGLDYADKPAPSTEPVNLNDPAVQKRLAAQWGYVSALSAEPVAWLYQHGMTGRTRIVMPDQVFTNAPGQWRMVGPLYQHPPAPSAEPVGEIVGTEKRGFALMTLVCWEPGFNRCAVGTKLYTTPPDHTALLRQALEALEERYVGALRDSALDALRAALGEKRC